MKDPGKARDIFNLPEPTLNLYKTFQKTIITAYNMRTQ